LEAAEERVNEQRTSLHRDFACEQESLKALLAIAEERHQELKDAEESFRQRELNFENQIEELTKALLESKQAVRELTTKHDGVVADLTRERANLPIQIKVLRMEMVSKAEMATLEQQRLLGNAQAENVVLQTRLNRLSGKPQHRKSLSVDTTGEKQSSISVHLATSKTKDVEPSDIPMAKGLSGGELCDENRVSPPSVADKLLPGSPRKADVQKIASPTRKILKERTKNAENQENTRVIRV